MHSEHKYESCGCREEEGQCLSLQKLPQQRWTPSFRIKGNPTGDADNPSFKFHPSHLGLYHWLRCFCVSFPGCRELLGGLCVCGDRGPGVHGEGWCQVPYWALWWQGDGQPQQEDHLSGAGQRQRSLKVGEGDRAFLIISAPERLSLNLMLCYIIT